MKTYGINVDIASLEAAAEATANRPRNCGWHSAVYYDPADGKVWTRDESEDSWGLESYVCALRTSRHVSAQRIMDALKQHLDFLKEIEEG